MDKMLGAAHTLGALGGGPSALSTPITLVHPGLHRFHFQICRVMPGGFGAAGALCGAWAKEVEAAA